MLQNNTEKLYYKELPRKDENTESSKIIQMDDSKTVYLVLRAKNEEIALLRKKLVDVTTQIWQSEQLISRLNQELDKVAKNSNLPVDLKSIRNLLREFKHSQSKNNLDNNLIADQDFICRLQACFPTLSSNDLRISSLLRLNLSTKEIAQKLGISAESANKARYRIRRKLKLPHNRDLVRFIIEF